MGITFFPCTCPVSVPAKCGVCEFPGRELFCRSIGNHEGIGMDKKERLRGAVLKKQGSLGSAS